MLRIDLTAGRPLLAARLAVMSAIPDDGTPVGYAHIALAVGEDCGQVVESLIDQGLISIRCVEGTRCYVREMH
jgi:hypothetical protein